MASEGYHEPLDALPEATRDMLEGKRLAARYFIRWELPAMRPALDLVARLDRTVLDASPRVL